MCKVRTSPLLDSQLGEVLAGVPDSGRDLTEDLHEKWLENRNFLEVTGRSWDFCCS